MENYLTAKQAAALLSMNERVFRKNILGKHIPFVQLRGLKKSGIRIRENDLMEYLESCIKPLKEKGKSVSESDVLIPNVKGPKPTVRPENVQRFINKYVYKIEE